VQKLKDKAADSLGPSKTVGVLSNLRKTL